MNTIKKMWNFLNNTTILWIYVIGTLPMFFLAFSLEGTIGIIGKIFYMLFVIVIYSKVVEKYILKKI